MPAEIDTGGHRVLHCDSHADCPTALSIHVSSSPNDGCRTVNLSVRIDDDESNEPQRRAPKDRPRRTTGNCVRKAEPLDYRRGSPSSNRDESSPTRVPRIGDEEETIQGGRDFLTKSGALTQPSHRRRGGRGGRGGRGDEVEDGDGLLGACRVSRKFPRANEDVTKDESSSVTWDSREDTGDGIERAESRLRDETERYLLAIAPTTKGSSIAKRRSLRDRSRTRLRRPSLYGSKSLDTDPTEVHHPRTAEGNSLLSSHHSRTRAKAEIYENDYKDVAEGFLSEKFSNDTRTNESERLDGSGRRDERSEDKRSKRLGQDSTDRKPISRVCFFLQLSCLLFLVVFGRYGLLGSSSVFRVSARPITNGLSVFGIIGAVNARSIDMIGDAGTRAERSANLSHISGTSRKIQMYIMNRHLQILPDGTVNGAKNDSSIYTIVQRLSTGKGKINIQGIATCLFVCMDVCGLLYGARNATKECEFNENLEQHNYNTYSSVRWSTAKKTLYIGLKSNGESKKVQVRGQLGKLSTNVRVLTQVISPDRLETMLNQHKVRHHCHHRRQVCDSVAQPPVCSTPPPREKDGRDRFRCRKRKKRRKRKRRCRSGEQPGPQCQVPEESIVESVTNVIEASSETEMISANSTTPESKRSCEGAASEEACRRQALSVPAKKRKSRIDDGGRNLTLNGKNKAPTSNAKKPNISVADSQSKKPDLTDGKKKKKKRTGPQQTRRWSTVASPSRKLYGPGTTSSSRTSSSLTAPVSEEQRASTATLSSSPSPRGASTALFSIRRPSSSPFDHKKPSPSSRNHLARPMNSRKVEKLSPGNAGLPVRPRSIPTISTTSRSEIASPVLITKVPEDRCTYTTTPLPQFSPVPSSLSLLWQEESDEDSSGSLSYPSLVDEESSSTVRSELAVESSTLAASDKVVAEATTFSLDEKNYEDGDFDKADTILRTTTRLPLERLAM
ncbi:uncharacterized protein LOC105197261 [Solenopsis invicta]|uniref:uncharacterized protein LOC105197261 n=1 Tax=Solenopsis invicta TaxID=13686 RepID=UPI00193DEFB4|nr:uncharacterized protein LOC105197261 [Solenopsis invicta]